jgi:hypothetical protein
VRLSADRGTESIAVTAERFVLPGGTVTRQIETAGHDPSFCDGHVTVNVGNGIAHPQGTVFDDRDLRSATRTARQASGVRRVASGLEISNSGSD